MLFEYFKLLSSIVLLSAFIASCSNGGSSGETYDLKGFHTEPIGGGATYASYMDQNGWPLSTGHVIGDVRNGTWTTYHPASKNLKTVTNFINGKKNGTEFTFNERGYLESVVGYRNNELHGLSAKYKNGRVLSETNYANGIMHGPFAVYDESRGKLQRSGSFLQGKQHGELLFYDENENVTLRYEYKNGEKVSGGIVDK